MYDPAIEDDEVHAIKCGVCAMNLCAECAFAVGQSCDVCEMAVCPECIQYDHEEEMYYCDECVPEPEYYDSEFGG